MSGLRLFVLCCCAFAACRETPIDPMLRERRGPLVTADQAPLPEDPAAGKRSELQWRKHLHAEEVERRMIFDRNRLAEHRALIKRFQAARERLDAPKTASDLQKARDTSQGSLHELQAGIDAIDRWKNSSFILPDYEALLKALTETYPAARLAAMSGNKDPLSDERASFDTHLRNMSSWLARLEKDGDEAFEEGEL